MTFNRVAYEHSAIRLTADWSDQLGRTDSAADEVMVVTYTYLIRTSWQAHCGADLGA